MLIILFCNSSASHSSSLNEDDEAGPSEFQSFSESMKNKFNSMSMRYDELEADLILVFLMDMVSLFWL